ncbi:MAG TPA: hypothetical protein VIC82_09480 [Candidatus Nanopelagicales bacterium]
MATVDLRMHRLGGGRGVAWVLTVMAVAAILDIVIQRPVERSGVAIATAGIVVIALSALLGIRPVVQELPNSLVVRNPWRTTVIPWTELVDVRSSDVLVVDTSDGPVRCFALPRRVRRGVGGSAMSQFGRMMPGPNAPSNPREVPSAVVQERLLTQAKALSVGQRSTETIVVSVDQSAVALTAVVVVCLVALVLLLFG